MPDRFFLDTNILLYVYSVDEKNKQNIAQSILNDYDNNIYISKQVINEICTKRYQ